MFKPLIDAGHILFPVNGDKTPCIPAWQTLTASVLPLGNAAAICIQPDTLIIDIDPRNGGNESWEQLKGDIDAKKIVETYAVQTGSGGLHYYLQKPTDAKLYKKHKNYPGIDFLTSGMYAITEGSVCVTGSYTRIQSNPNPITWQQTPQELIRLLTKPLLPTYSVETASVLDEEEANVSFTRFLLYHAKPAIQGSNGDDQTYSVACMGRDYGLSPEAVTNSMLLHWNEKCSPPWNEGELLYKVRNAYKYGQNPSGCRTVNFAPVPSDSESLPVLLHSWPITDKNGKASAKQAHLQMYFEIDRPFNNLETNPLYQLFRRNEASGLIEYKNPAPWHAIGKQPKELNDNEELFLARWFSDNLGVDIAKEKAYELIEFCAMRYSYHPVKDWFEQLVWDKTPRIHGLFTRYCGTEQSDYAEGVGAITMDAIVKRIMEPGCQYDYMVILEGKQGIRKSTFCNILALTTMGDFHAELSYSENVKQMEEICQGKIVVEMAELAGMREKDINGLKLYLTSHQPTFRAAYGRNARTHKRTFVFVGTTNKLILLDQTGNRRFLPIKCNGVIKTNELKEDLPQLYAEAYYRYLHNRKPFLTLGPELMADIESRQTEAVDIGITVWDERIRQYLDARITERISLSHMLEHYLGIPTDRHPHMARQIGPILRRLGWERYKTNGIYKWRATKEYEIEL